MPLIAPNDLPGSNGMCTLVLALLFSVQPGHRRPGMPLLRTSFTSLAVTLVAWASRIRHPLAPLKLTKKARQSRSARWVSDGRRKHGCCSFSLVQPFLGKDRPPIPV
eukprot:scaffold206503_cov15-Tisochrysis_lutea.AAC.1